MRINKMAVNYDKMVLEAFRENADEILGLQREHAVEIQNQYNTAYREALESTCTLIENGGFSIR